MLNNTICSTSSITTTTSTTAASTTTTTATTTPNTSTASTTSTPHVTTNANTSALKLVGVYFAKNLDNLAQQQAHLKKCQIPLFVEDCPTFILQLDQQQLLMHHNLTVAHECSNNSQSKQVQLKHSTNSTTSSHPVKNISANTSCSVCNSMSNATRKDYDAFLNKYNKCSSSNNNNKTTHTYSDAEWDEYSDEDERSPGGCDSCSNSGGVESRLG